MEKVTRAYAVRRFFGNLGPGLITGAADVTRPASRPTRWQAPRVAVRHCGPRSFPFH